MKDLNWRKKKKIVRNISNAIMSSGYFIDCRNHPCKMTMINPYSSSNPSSLYDSDVDGISLIDGTGISCSMYYCRPYPLTKKQAEEMALNYENVND